MIFSFWALTWIVADMNIIIGKSSLCIFLIFSLFLMSSNETPNIFPMRVAKLYNAPSVALFPISALYPINHRSSPVHAISFRFFVCNEWLSLRITCKLCSIDQPVTGEQAECTSGITFRLANVLEPTSRFIALTATTIALVWWYRPGLISSYREVSIKVRPFTNERKIVVIF